MKNKSCQAKKKGKLVEMPIDETINSCWQEWAEFLKEEEVPEIVGKLDDKVTREKLTVRFK